MPPVVTCTCPFSLSCGVKMVVSDPSIFISDSTVAYALRTGMAEIANLEVAKITATVGVAQFLGSNISGRRLAGTVVADFEIGMASVAETATSRVDLMTVDAARMVGVLNARLAGEGLMVNITSVSDIVVPPMNAHVSLEGSYCGDWGHTGDDWCFVNAGVFCGAVTVDAASGYYRSNGPCEAAVESRSRRVRDAATSVARICWVAAVAGFALMLAVAGALWDWLALRRAAAGPAQRMFVRKQVIDPELAKKQKQIKDSFREAQKEAKVKKAAGLLTEDSRLELYGLAMQASGGDRAQERSPNDSAETELERKKREAWNAHRGMAREEAMERYCQAVERLE